MPTVAETKEKVQLILTQMGQVQLESDGRYSLRQGSTRISISVEDFGDGDTWVKLVTPILLRAKESPELFEHVALNSHRLKYGTLFAERADDGSIWVFMLHGILGTYLDNRELELAVALMARSADEMDDDLQARFGGERVYEED